MKAHTLCTPAVKGPPPPVPPVLGTCEDPTNQATFILDCDTGAGYEVSAHFGPPPAPGAPALRILGIYEASSNHLVTGQATVNVKRQERLVLVLSSYESTHWTVNVEPGAILERVLLSGFEPQTATVPAGVPVENHSPTPLGDACAVEWPTDNGGCDADVLAAAAEQVTGLCLTSFHGCYRATRFSIPAGNVGSASGAFVDDPPPAP